ncbi:MAG: TonB family protein, partial [Candidatus Magnetominusculus sp. LBB02]|nr:TonB family protein [Candidatus Magnetominusculus sp. LBB02]
IEPAKPAKYEMKEHPRPAPEPKQETKAAEIRPEPPKPMEAHKAPPVKPKEDGPKILKEAAKSAATKPEQTKIPAATPSKEQPKVAENASGKDTTSVEDRISMLRSKKRLEQHAALRSMVDLNAKSAKMGQSPTGASQSTSPSFGDAVNNEYSDIVGAHVRKRWAYPESAKKSLEAIVVFTIRQDGRVDGVKLEKSSGNSFFDRSALSAVNKSVPMPQPPLDSYEVGIRFTQ